ncbi:MAG: insulinase family protein [Treponema sp.]|jgi:Zn-dependent M16 (insulinase) family peptidase|nr:insulinase family protein [Treponema sp.]
MKQGDLISGFEVLETLELEELKARGIWARHRSGAELFHVHNDDPENLFAFAFTTAPEDSTGAAHILEHSVLCGSRRYPLKDPFVVLLQGSLATFLNAWTFPDKTVYPASSTNEKDYFNLMSVYADAVFRPLLSEWTFMQEGWRLAPVSSLRPAGGDQGGPPGLEYTGVVYNEMKGAYSSMDAYAGLWSVKAVMPGTPYSFESGGDPECIPDLSWEALREFHRRRYAPANCRIFLAGNIPVERQMEFLHRECLAGLESGNPAGEIPETERWRTPRFFRVPCPGGLPGAGPEAADPEQTGAAGAEAEDKKPQVILSWLCSSGANPGETIALSCLAEILLGHDGSPLTRALLESGLGEDISPSSGLEGELRETVFCAGLRGFQGPGAGAPPETRGSREPEEAYRPFEELVLGELRRLVKEGIPKEEIDAALLSMEFSHREIKRSHGPYSLVWLRRSLRGWLYGNKPWESLLFTPNFNALKRRFAENPRYFESLIEKYLLNNPHRALIAVEPEEDFLVKKETKLVQRLKNEEASLSPEARKRLEEKAAELERIQKREESGAALECIPHPSRKDLIPEVEAVPSELGVLGGGVPRMIHPLFTNGVTYADLAFPVDTLEPEDYPWLPFFARTVVSMGLPGMDYGEVSSLLARTAGGFYALLETGSAVPGSPGEGPNPAARGTTGTDLAEDGALRVPSPLLARDWIIYRVKALDEKLADSLDLIRRLIQEADFSDLRRLRDLAVEMKNDGDSSLAPAGHGYASGRSGRRFSRARAVDELWNGLGQIPFARRLAAMDMGEVRDRLISIRNALLKAGVFVNLSASEEALPGALKAAEMFAPFGYPRRANPRCLETERFFSLSSWDARAGEQPERAEVYGSPSLQVGFAALSLPAAPYGSPGQAAELVFAHELSYGPLWESIRMMGGAYGAFARPDNLEGVFSLSTYRDPDPLRSLSAIPAILKNRGALTIDGDSLEKMIIGVYARETRPRTPAEKGFSGFLRSLYGITQDHRLSRLRGIIGLTAEESGAAARRLAEASEAAAAGNAAGTCPVVIAGMEQARKAAKKLGVNLKELPL